MKKYIIGVMFLLIGCQAEAVKTPPPEQPIIKPIVVEEPTPTDATVPDCSEYERSTDNPAINEWLKKELDECLELK